MSAARPSPRAPRARADREGEALALWVVLSRAYMAVSQHAQADIARHELTPGEFAILEVLYHKGPLLLGEIQRRILVSSGGITFLVDRLAKKGLAQRRQCAEDRRARYAALTPAGTALMTRIFPPHARAIADAVAGLSAAEQRTATRLLRKLGLTAAHRPSAGR